MGRYCGACLDGFRRLSICFACLYLSLIVIGLKQTPGLLPLGGAAKEF